MHYTIPQVKKTIVAGVLTALGALIATILTVIDDGAIDGADIGVLATAWTAFIGATAGVFAAKNAPASEPSPEHASSG